MKPRNKKNTCGLCHVTCTSFQAVNKLTVEVLEVLLLKTTLHHTEASVICKSCETKLEQLFKFKTVCLETEDCLAPFLDSKTRPYPLDLRDVYLDVVKDTNNVATKPKNRVCRLCMQLVEGGFTSLTNLEGSRTLQQNILVEYMPEVNLEATKEPEICMTCEESLQTYYNFALNVSNVTPTVPQPQSAVDDSAEESDSSPSVSGEDEQNFSSLQYRNDKLCRPKAALYECKFCLYKSHSKRSLKLHQKIHQGKKWSGFSCSFCAYKTSSRDELKQHAMTHTNGSNYRCDVCGYEVDHTGRFKRHMLIHTKAKNHKCNKCSFVTHRLDTLRDHMQTHVPLSDRNLKKCKICSVQVMTKMKRHMLTHHDEGKAKVFKCPDCLYHTTRKDTLKRHMLNHKSKEEVPLFGCHVCEFSTKLKSSLKTHMLRHQKGAQVQMYKCETCEYKTKYESNFKSHSLVHKKMEEVQTYQCYHCTYQTKNKRSLEPHMKRHMDKARRTMYKCNLCDFETSWKQGVKIHVIRRHYESLFAEGDSS